MLCMYRLSLKTSIYLPTPHPPPTHTHTQIIHVSDNEINDQELEESEPQEVLVDDPVKSRESCILCVSTPLLFFLVCVCLHITSPQNLLCNGATDTDLPLSTALLDVDDAMTTESRTPNTTPPERRRENVSELSDVLEALQMVGRRNSQPVSSHVLSATLQTVW